MPVVGNFTWDAVDRPAETTTFEVGVGKAYATVQDAAAAAQSGDTIKVYMPDGTDFSFIDGPGGVLEVGAGKQYASVQEAYTASGEDDIILVYPGTYNFIGNEYYPSSNHDNPILIQHSVSIIGVGDVTFHSNYVSKGMLVTGGDENLHLYIENITFEGASNESNNGAGIRLQAGDLTVVDSHFVDNQSGVLANEDSGDVHIVGSSFDNTGSDGYSHALYIRGDSLVVEDSTFTGAIRGHHVKSTVSDQTVVVNSVLDDDDGSASYSIDVTGGGDLLVDGNTLIKGANADNKTFVYYDTDREGGTPGEVVIQNNSFDASAYPDQSLMQLVVNMTDSVVQVLDNTVIGVPEERLVIGLGHIEGVTLDGILLPTKTYDDGADLLSANNDIHVETSSSPDGVRALAGDDSLIGLNGSDTLWGDDGNDLLVGGDGNDYLFGGAADDTVFGGSGTDIIGGGDGNDLLVGGGSGDRLYGGVGNDTLVSESGYTHAQGGDGDDLIIGSDHSPETLSGSAGNDTLYGGAGGDSLLGGDGTDIAVYNGVFNPDDLSQSDFEIFELWGGTYIRGITEAGMIELGNGLNYYNGDIQYDDVEVFKGVEFLQFDNGVYDATTGVFTAGLQLVDLAALTANLPSNPANTGVVEGTEGDDTFLVDPFDGFVTYEGGAGYDQALASEDGMPIRMMNFSAGALEFIGANGFANIHILGTSGNNSFNFSATVLDGITHIDAGIGDDTIVGSAGNDIILGGFGNDSMIGGAGDDTFVLTAGAGIDYIDGGAGADTVLLEASDVTFAFSNQHLSAGTVELIDASGFVNVAIMANNSNNLWDFSGTTLTDISLISLQDGNDTLIGSSGDDVVDGGAGTDSLRGGDGNDTFLVGLGSGEADQFLGEAGFDRIVATADGVAIGLRNFAAGDVELIDADGHTGVTIVGTNSYTDNMDFSGTALTGISLISLKGGSDRLIASAGDDVIDAGSGWDILDGGDGNDTFLVGVNSDYDHYEGGAGADTILATADNVTIGLHSNTALPTASALSGIEVIDAGGHSGVTLAGLNGGSGGQADLLDLSSITLVGVEKISLQGGNDRLIASAGDDVIDAGSGWDILDGGAGNDTFLVGINGDYDHYEGGAGVDTILATADNVSIGLHSNTSLTTRSALSGIEIIDAGGHTGVTLTGLNSSSGGQADLLDLSNVTLVGIEKISLQSGNDSIVGSAAGDVIEGGSGWDRIDGGGGNDTLTGGSEDDRFVFDADWGVDTVTDFADGQDRLDLTALGIQFGDLSVVQVGADAVISFGGDQIILLNTDIGTISTDDFWF